MDRVDGGFGGSTDAEEGRRGGRGKGTAPAPGARSAPGGGLAWQQVRLCWWCPTVLVVSGSAGKGRDSGDGRGGFSLATNGDEYLWMTFH